jgi:hypothetical protein
MIRIRSPGSAMARRFAKMRMLRRAIEAGGSTPM